MPDRRHDTDAGSGPLADGAERRATHRSVPELLPLPASLTADRERSKPVVGAPIDGGDNARLTVVTQRPKRARRGDVIGRRYVVDGQIAKGGMGRILRVRHQTLGKYFALKVIRPPIATDQRVCEMFYREARLASAMEHENICSIIDFGNDPEVGLFMVMELLEGMSLHDKLARDGRMAAKAACSVVWDIGKAIKHMHARAIVHGDIKSSNILLCRTDHKHRLVKLTDFGLARVDIAGPSGHVQGTPEYMAPELILGQAASPLSDIYALGVLFHELLVGMRPFVGETEAVLRQHLEEPLPPVSRLLYGAIDERADEIIARATAKDASERPKDMDSLLFELRAFMNMLGIGGTYQRPRAVAEPPRSTRQRTRSGSRRLQGGYEVFEHAPVPLAAVTPSGRVRVANAAFMEFLGTSHQSDEVDLTDTLLPAYYDDVLTDLALVSTNARELKRVLWLRDTRGQVVEVAVIMRPGPNQSPATGGDVHIALHPLGRRPRADGEGR